MVLDGGDVSEKIRSMINDTVDEAVDTFCQGDVADDWNLTGLRESWSGILTSSNDFKYNRDELSNISREDIKEELQKRAIALYESREAEYGDKIMRELERVILLQNVDKKWMDHIDAMSDLKQGIYLRSFAQRDPVVEYRHEGFSMYDEMIASIREDTVRMVLTVQIRREAPPQRVQVMKPDAENAGAQTTVKKSSSEKTGVNAPCPCGSGKKFKKCCG
jgi:preprotein translocase subunit SecA